MAIYHIGSLIKRLRKQKGLMQEELAFSILDQTNLSKIESGYTTPNRKTAEALLQKLGYDPYAQIDFFLNDEEATLQKTMDKLDAVLSNETAYGKLDDFIKEANALIAALEGNEKFMQNKLNVQYVLFKKALVAIFGRATDTPLEMLADAIKISIPAYQDALVEDYHLSKQEASIINLTAKVYFDNDRKEEAITLLTRLKANFENHCIDKQTMGALYPSVAYNLAGFLCKVGRNEESIQACDNAIEICKQTNQYRTMPLIIGYKASCLFELGQLEEHARLVKQVYHSADMFGMVGQREIAQREAERYGIDL